MHFYNCVSVLLCFCSQTFAQQLDGGRGWIGGHSRIGPLGSATVWKSGIHASSLAVTMLLSVA